MNEFSPIIGNNIPSSGAITWRSPSNIALVKYWGKYNPQLPANPSISFTLQNCNTTTTVSYEISENFDFEVYVDGKRAEDFDKKVGIFIDRIAHLLPFLKEMKLRIDTSNTFPHSSGIASSASGMSALALCFLSIVDNNHKSPEFIEKASILSRLGSGSAARSVIPQIGSWGVHKDITDSSDRFATRHTDLHPIFNTFQDTIMIVESGKKEVSSTVGHGLMNNHPFAETRFQQAHENLSKLLIAMKSGDLRTFTEIVESEALTLHSMMMTSSPYFILMKPNTLKIIEKTWAYRKTNGSNLTFTLDAGANVHLLYPLEEKEAVESFIKTDLIDFCENQEYICDTVGLGPEKIENA